MQDLNVCFIAGETESQQDDFLTWVTIQARAPTSFLIKAADLGLDLQMPNSPKREALLQGPAS